MRIFISRKGRITLDNGEIVQRYYLTEYPKVTVNAAMDYTGHLPVTERMFKRFAEIRTFHGEKGYLYIEEELLKEEHKNFLSFLLNMIEDTIPKKIDSIPWEMSLSELEYTSNRNSRRVHHLLERLHDHHPIKRKIKTKPEEKYMRIVDLD